MVDALYNSVNTLTAAEGGWLTNSKIETPEIKLRKVQEVLGHASDGNKFDIYQPLEQAQYTSRIFIIFYKLKMLQNSVFEKENAL